MTAFIIKIIAMVTMLCDHTYSLFAEPPLGWYIGRLAFPLYALMLVESYRHLKDDPKRLKKYVVSLAILAAVSEVGYDLVFSGKIVDVIGQNQILQFLTFVLAAILSKKISKNIFKALLWIGVIALNQFCLMGYYALGIITMLLLWWYLERYEGEGLVRRFLDISAVMVIFWIGNVALELVLYPEYLMIEGHISWPLIFESLTRFAVTLLLIPVIAFYNGQYGNPPKWFRVIYRYFYPAHLYILALIAFLLKR
ncbi:MAG: hypothetical protein J5829_09350 [Lachnospiraceae bacterium]|nr:hypothetical protein [Lachnospiraceae bacterium]